MNYDLIYHIDSCDKDSMYFAINQVINYKTVSVQEYRHFNTDDVMNLGSSSSFAFPVPFSIFFIVNGPAVRYVTKEYKQIYEAAHNAYLSGIEFFVGGHALASLNIMKDDIWEFAEVVPSGLLKIVQLQKKGFSYIKF